MNSSDFRRKTHFYNNEMRRATRAEGSWFHLVYVRRWHWNCLKSIDSRWKINIALSNILFITTREVWVQVIPSNTELTVGPRFAQWELFIKAGVSLWFLIKTHGSGCLPGGVAAKPFCCSPFRKGAVQMRTDSSKKEQWALTSAPGIQCPRSS